MNTFKSTIIFAFILIALLSCSDDEEFIDVMELENAQCWSEPDYQALPTSAEIFSTTKPMKFNIGNSHCFKYRIYEPLGSDTITCKLPLIIYLHGLDARGTDNNAQMNYAASYFVIFNNNFPSYIVFPQCPEDAYWGLTKRPSDFTPSKMELNPSHSYMDFGLIKLIEELTTNYNIDSRRVFLVGHSMGGIGTLDMIASHPNIFAAAISFCGTINPNRFTTNHEVPLMLFHNADDDIITVEGSRKTYQRLLQLGSEAVYTEGASGGHVCWTEAVKTPDMLLWIFKHTL
ncbi:MAG: alpha/beta hydrolase-fold protein [Muribaculaceae bacterium]